MQFSKKYSSDSLFTFLENLYCMRNPYFTHPNHPLSLGNTTIKPH